MTWHASCKGHASDRGAAGAAGQRPRTGSSRGLHSRTKDETAMTRSRILGSLLALLAFGAAARADLLWDYNWSTTPGLFPTQTGGVTLAATPAGTGTGKQQVDVAILGTF